MKKRNRILSLMLAILLIVGMLPISTLTAFAVTGENFTLTIKYAVTSSNGVEIGNDIVDEQITNIPTNTMIDLSNYWPSALSVDGSDGETYYFAGFVENSNGDGTPVHFWKIDGNKTLYAGWTFDSQVSISLDTNGGTMDCKAIRYPKKFADIDRMNDKFVPIRDGYVFLGWSLDDDGTADDPGVEITENCTLYAVWKEVHSHCVCGGNTNIGDHSSHPSVEFTEWTSTNSLPVTSGSYVLMNDITLTGDAWAFVNVNVTICLNGHTITRDTQEKGLIDVNADATLNICDCVGGGRIKGNNDGYKYKTKSGLYVEGTGVINMYGGAVSECGHAGVMTKNDGTFNMYGGEISWNRCTTDGGGVRLESGTFNMYSGTINDNYAEKQGGGVYVSGTATFNMRGGTITQNTTSWVRDDVYGGGVFVYYGGVMMVSGAPVITKNETSETSNLHLQYHETYETQVSVFIGELTEGANIGVSLYQPGVFSFDGREHIKYFTSDNPDYEVAKAGKNLMLVEKAHKHTLTYSKYLPYQIIEKCSCGHEETATIKSVKVGGGSIYDGRTDFSPTVEYSEDWSSEKLESICFKENEQVDESVDAGSYVARLTIGGITAELWYQVERRHLIVKAEDHTIAYGEVPIGKGVTYSEFVNGENENVLSGKLDWDSDYIQYGALGTYSIRPKGLESNNYEFIYEPGTLKVVAANQSAPTTPTGVNATFINTADGKITGVDSTMEYHKDGEANYIAVTGTEITGLAAGTYYVRFAANTNYNASPEIRIIIALGDKLTPTIDDKPTASRVIIGGKLSESVLTGGEASVPGEFAWIDPDAVMNIAGRFDMLVRFTPTDTETYKTVDFEIEVEVVVCETASGEHDFTEQMNDVDEHWIVCAKCKTEKPDSHEAHKGGTATCTYKAKCTECGEEYGDFGEHDWDTNWTTDNNKHWHKCLNSECTEIKDDNPHSGGMATCKDKAKCEICDMAYGELGAHGETEVKDAKDATCTEPGYTGNTYCTVCNQKIAEGDEIAATGHLNKETRNKKAATCTEKGNTGDIWCTDCNTELEIGTDIAAVGHDYENGKCKTCGTADPNYKPTTNPSDDSKSPQTGDNSNMVLWFALLIISSIGLAGTAIYGRRKRMN